MGELQWLEFELLQEFPELKHAIFLRHGGVSTGVFGSLNFGVMQGDDPLLVAENRRRAMSIFPQAELISANQVHGSTLHFVQGPYLGQEKCDAFLTREKNKALMIQHADCQASIFFDPQKKILAHVHCGWRGNVQNIYAITVEAFKSLGSNPADLFVCISPSLGPERSEFINFKTELPLHFLDFQWKETYFNLWEISKMQLRLAGILPAHMECAEICTYDNPADYFSYRREKVSGRHAAFAMLC